MIKNLAQKVILLGALSTLPVFSNVSADPFAPPRVEVKIESLNLFAWDVKFSADYISDKGLEVFGSYKIGKENNGFYDARLLFSRGFGWIPEKVRARLEGLDIIRGGLGFEVEYFYENQKVLADYFVSKKDGIYHAILQKYNSEFVFASN